MPMNTANKLTLARVFMIPLFLVIVYWGFPGSRYVALGVYILACLTDLLDGYVARHYNQVSDFGKFADPLADKCLVMAALCWFVETGDMVGWVLAVVLLREFAVSGMRLIAAVLAHLNGQEARRLQRTVLHGPQHLRIPQHHAVPPQFPIHGLAEGLR